MTIKSFTHRLDVILGAKLTEEGINTKIGEYMSEGCEIYEEDWWEMDFPRLVLSLGLGSATDEFTLISKER